MTRLLLMIMWLLHWLPLPLLGRLGDGIGTLLFLALRSRRHVALTNLRLCMPELSEAERRHIAKNHFQAYSRSIFERAILWWASEARIRRLIVIESALPLAEVNASPTILLCPHFVCLGDAGIGVFGLCAAKKSRFRRHAAPRSHAFSHPALILAQRRHQTDFARFE